MADFIRTVTGDISPLELGYCQCHEHLLLAKGKSYTIDPSLYMDDEKKSADELLSYYAAGGRALVDAQPVGCGRMADGLRRISEASGVKIIASTGFHKLLFYPEDHVVYRSSAEELAELFAGELMLGMFVDHVNGEAPFTERDAAKAGIIKTASDGRDITSGEDVLPIYRKLFTAAAMAAVKTGAPVITHLEMGNGADSQFRVLTENGVPANQIIMSHLDRVVDRTDPNRYLRVAESGVFLQFDTIGRFKYHSDEDEAWLIAMLCEHGFADQILIGLDTTNKRLRSYGGALGLTYILDTFRNILAANGVGDDLFARFTLKNPQRALCFH